MDSLANYGSDEEYEDGSSEKMGTAGPAGSRTRTEEADVNYDEVQMDLSEESNNNNSEDDHLAEISQDMKRSCRSKSREDPRVSKSDTRSNRHRRDRSAEERISHRKDDDRDRYDDRSKKYESKSKYDGREGTSYKDRSRDDRKKYRRSSSRDRKRSTSRDRGKDLKISDSREKDRSRRSGSKEKSRRSSSREKLRRSRSRERRRSRSPRRSDRERDHRRRSRSNSKDRDYRGPRYGKRNSKIAQLEKLGIEIKTPESEFVTPQMLLQRTMDEQVQKVKNSTGIELPKYYNPAAMNPARYADQIQKRRLLWQKKDTPTEKAKPATGKVWQQTTFAQDNDGKVASKFKRLMGIKDNASPPVTAKESGGRDILKKQEEMFSSMEQQYEVARTATHTMRGVGLGFGTFNNNYPR